MRPRSLVPAVLLGAALVAPAAARPWVAAAAWLDVDGAFDALRVETRRPEFLDDPVPCATCGRRVEGRFELVVTLSRTHRTVRSPVFLHAPGETLWFWRQPPAVLVAGDYDGDGQPEINLGQPANGVNWEYGLFTVRRDGTAVRLAKDAPEIALAPGGTPSTPGIVAVPGGLRFSAFGNGGERSGWWTFTCLWQAAAGIFTCAAAPGGAPANW